MTCPENVSSRRRAARRPRGPRAAEACRGANNNDHNMVYVNSDPSGHFNSSSATLTVPAGARVVHAYLYWGADLARGVQRPPNDASDDAPAGGDPVTNTLWKTASLRVGSGSYATIDAAAAGRNGVWESIPSWYQQPGQTVGSAYQVCAEVTNELQAGISATRRRTRSGGREITVTVANVQAGKGYNRHGGWSLVVVWESPTARFRNITLFDGFEFVQVEGGQQLVLGPLDFKGFSTPASGPVDAHVTVWAYEGDRAITGDYLALGNTSSSCSGLPHQSDTLHPVDNFFNSTISAAGVDLGGRSPEYSNQLGFDLATLNLPEGTIANGATGASVCLGSVGDTYFFGGLVFDSLIRAPNVQIDKVVTPTDVNPGNTVTYTTQVSNPERNPDDPLYPTAAATNLVTRTTLCRPVSTSSASPATPEASAATSPPPARSGAPSARSPPKVRSRMPTALGSAPCRRVVHQPLTKLILLATRRTQRISRTLYSTVATRRRPTCTAPPAAADGRPRRGQDRLDRHREAGQTAHLADRRH